MVDGRVSSGAPITAMQAGTEAEIDEIGHLTPAMRAAETMAAGEVGYVITGIKDVARLQVGDTLTSRDSPATEPLPGYREVKPVVFCGLFPIDTDRYARPARRARAPVAERRRSELGARDLGGAGVRVPVRVPGPAPHGHRARAARARVRPRAAGARRPNVRYEVRLRGGELVEVHSPAEMPDPGRASRRSSSPTSGRRW